MNFLNKEKKEARPITIILGIILACTYSFANWHEADMLLRSMTILMGFEMNTGYYVTILITTALVSYMIFTLFVSMAYSIAYRTLVNKTRDIKVMPISKESFMNHTQFVMIFSNLIIGGIAFILRQNIIIEPVVGMLTRMFIKILTYAIVLLMLCRVGIGDNVKKKLFGGFLTPLAVLAVLMV